MPGWQSQSQQRSYSRSKSRSRSSSSRFGRSAIPKPGLQDLSVLLQKFSDVLFFLTFATVLFLYAGRTPLGQFGLLAGTVATLGCWLLSQMLQTEKQWRWTGMEWILLGGLGLITLQLMPLPEGLLYWLSPQMKNFPGVTANMPDSAMALPAWNQLSFNPHETRLSLSSILCVMLLFLFLVQRFQDRDYARRTVTGLGLATALFSVFAIVQYLCANGKFFWIFEHPFGTTYSFAKGSFTNANHFAGFVCLMTGPLLAWTLAKPERMTNHHSWRAANSGRGELKLICGSLACLVLLLGAVLSNSRGGLVLATVAIVIPLILVSVRKLADSRMPLLLAVMAMFILGGISYFCEDYFHRNMLELTAGDVEQIDQREGRRFVWQSNLLAQSNFFWTGMGLGTHLDVIPAYHEKDLGGRLYTHAENSYLQLATELGIGAWILLGLAAVVVFWRLITVFFYQTHAQGSRADQAILAGVAGSLFVFLVHGSYDFGWYAPAYMLQLAVLVAFLFSWKTSEKTAAPGTGSFLSTCVGFSLMAGMLGGLLTLGPAVYRAALAEIPETRYLHYRQAAGNFETPEDEMLSLRIRIKALQEALKLDPENGRHHQRMAGSLRRLLELNAAYDTSQMMPVTQIRAAVYQGGFEEQEQLKSWLQNPGIMQKTYPLAQACLKEARTALSLSPFFVSAWLVQADYCFIESADEALVDYYMQSARQVGPASSAITLTAGYHAWCRGEIESALETWKPVFSNSSQARSRILELTTASFGPDDLIAIFEPDYEGLRHLASFYKDPQTPEYQQAALRLSEAVLQDAPQMESRQQLQAYTHAFSLLSRSQQQEATQNFIQVVTETQPSLLPLRKSFGQWLVNQKSYSEALPHLEFYLRGVTHDPQTLKLIQVCRQELTQAQKRQTLPAGFRRIY